MRRSALCAALLSGCTGTEFQIKSHNDAESAPSPAVSVSPTYLDFGERSTRIPEPPLPFWVTNTGAAPLEVDRVELEFGDGFSMLTRVFEHALEPGASIEVEVGFEPTHPFVTDGRVLVVSDDPERPRVEVSLQGARRDPVARDRSSRTRSRRDPPPVHHRRPSCSTARPSYSWNPRSSRSRSRPASARPCG
ncbi:MAG: hypothetical protein ACI8PZ_001950 [Myxococcota bacterium]|jgi:hypothetical protein